MAKYTNARYPDKINDLVDNDGNVNIPGGGGETPFEWISTVIDQIGETKIQIAIDEDTFFAIADTQPIKIDLTLNDVYYPLVYKELIPMGVCYNTHEDGMVGLVKMAINPSTGLPEAFVEIQLGADPYEWRTSEESSSEEGNISYLEIGSGVFEDILSTMPQQINLTLDFEDDTLNCVLSYEKALPLGLRYSGVCVDHGIIALDLIWNNDGDYPQALLYWEISGDEPQPGPGGDVNDWQGIADLLNEIAQNIDEGHYVPVDATFEIKNSYTYNLTGMIESIDTDALAALFGLTINGVHYIQGCAFNVNLTESYPNDDTYFTHPLSWQVGPRFDAETGDSHIDVYLDESYIEQTGNNGWQIHVNGIDSHTYDMHSWPGRVSGTITIRSIDIWE